jgi:CheY-like chemotaxis protein
MLSKDVQDSPVTILLVEDHLPHAELVKRTLEAHQITHRLYHVRDGEAALAYLFWQGEYADRAKSPRPHVVLLDLHLPRLSGLEVLKAIRASRELHTIPVVVLTTSTAERDVVHAYEYHVNSYLVKPVDYAQFSQLMHALGFYWLNWNYYPKA